MAYLKGKQVVIPNLYATLTVFVPTISIAGDILTITDTSGHATSYDIYANGELVGNTVNKVCDLSKIITEVKRYFTITVKANSDTKSIASNSVRYRVDRTPTEGLNYILQSDSNGSYYLCRDIGTATDTDIIIASEIEGIPVKRIGTGGEEANFPNITSIAIPSSIEYIGYCTFDYSTSLTDIYISDLAAWCMTNSVGDTFRFAKNLYLKGGLITGELVIPCGVSRIGGGFRGYDNLTSVIAPNDLIEIGAGAFRNCYNLEKVTISGSKFETIGVQAFMGSNLKEITIGNSVTKIGEEAFESCRYLTDVYYKGTEKEWSRVSKADSGLIDITVHFSYEKVKIPAGVYRFKDNLTGVIQKDTSTGGYHNETQINFRIPDCSVTLTEEDAAYLNEMAADAGLGTVSAGTYTSKETYNKMVIEGRIVPDTINSYYIGVIDYFNDSIQIEPENTLLLALLRVGERREVYQRPSPEDNGWISSYGEQYHTVILDEDQWVLSNYAEWFNANVSLIANGSEGSA